MKIMFIGNDTTYVYNLRDQVIERLIKDGHEIVIVCEMRSFQQELIQMGCRLISITIGRHGKNPFHDITLYSEIKRIVKKENPDLVLTFNIKPNIYGGLACRRHHTRYMANITGLGTAVEYPGLLQKLSVFLYGFGLKDASCLFFQNEENKLFFISRKIIEPDRHCYVLPGSGVNLQRHQPIDYPPKTNAVSFLFIARILKEKGIDLYLNAAKRVKEQYPECVFHICGGCDDHSYQKILEEENGKTVIYHNEQKDLIPFYSEAHCIVHPSYYPEGMSNVLLEAAAHCRPIITTNRAGCKEIVEDGITGYIIPVRDEEALVEAITKFIRLDWKEKEKMGTAGRKRIESRFDRKIVADCYSAEIKSLFGEDGES